MCGLACSQGGLHAAECAVLLEVRLRLQAAEGDKVFRAWAEHEEELQTRVCEYFTITDEVPNMAFSMIVKSSRTFV